MANAAENSSGVRLGRIILIGLAVIVLSFLSFGLIEIVPSDSVAVVQFLNGNLGVYTNVNNPVFQWFGTVTIYPRLDIYEFEAPIMFNDAGEGTLKGSIQWKMPLDYENVVEIHMNYASADGVREGLINKVIDKCVYMTGPLMSSAESYASMKNYLIYYIEDQVKLGVYKTVARDVKMKDPITGDEKTVKQVEIVKDSKGVIERQEQPVLGEVGVNTSNLAIARLDYSEKVRAQIAEQQSMTMAVQTSMAEAKKAEQNFITITKNGEAAAAKARWEKEEEKAAQVTEADMRRSVAALDVQTAELRKQEKLKQAEGESEYRRRMMSADNALEFKGNLWLKAQEAWATAWAQNGANLVPYIQSGGGSGANGMSSLETFLSLKSAESMNALGIDLSVGKVKK